MRQLLTVLHVHFDSRSVGRLGHPDIQILGLARLEKENIVAVVEFGQLVELIELSLGVELCVLAAVRHHRSEVVEKVSVSESCQQAYINRGSRWKDGLTCR